MTGAEIAVQPATQEVVSLAEPTDVLARAIRETRALEEALRAFKDAVSGELLARMDSEATWTVHLPDGTKLSAPRPGAEEWDAKALEAGLAALVERGVIGAGAKENAIGYEPKVKRRGIDGLRALAKTGNTEVAELLERCRKPSRKRSITIETQR